MIEAIETRYRGRLFRSRLEARWAVVFETLHLPWVYEMEGFHLPSRDYLPDFWLPRQKVWLEIKPGSHEENTDYLNELAIMTGSDAILIEGQIPWPYGSFVENEKGNDFATIHFQSKDEGDCEYMLCRCLFCGEYGFQWMGSSNRLKCCPENISTEGKRYTSDEETILAAYDAARTRRFEHGFNEWE